MKTHNNTIQITGGGPCIGPEFFSAINCAA